ncbi:MAG: DUF2934 domain-containing protein [Acidobacteriota bacterium]|nr:DUF2934 domain-containing protein [Acidobacteriota bacterium]
MRYQTVMPAESGRVLAPDTARPTDQEIRAFAYEFWKARGCPEWLWGGLRGTRLPAPPPAAPARPLQGAKR